MKAANAVTLIESAYGLELSTEKWLELMAEKAAAALDSSRGAMVFRYDAAGDWINVRELALHGLSPDFAHDFFNQPDTPPEAARALAREFKSARFHTLREIMDRLGVGALFGAILDRHGVKDMTCINGLDPSGRGCMVCVADDRQKHSPRTVHLWHRLAAHVSAGNRLRAALEEIRQPGGSPVDQAEAVLSPAGKVEQATGSAEPRSARKALLEALVRIDAARSEPDDARRSVELWRGLVGGRWSLVEHFERDGRRYFLAHKNDPELKEDHALTTRERQVLGYAELGHSNKLIGYELGLSTTTVSTLLVRARKKLGETS